MKPIIRHLMAVIALGSISLISGYAIVHDSTSAVPSVDFYVYKASSMQDAENKHKEYAKKLGYPEKLLNVFDKVRGFTKPISEKLAAPTQDISLYIQQGFDLGTEGLKKINELFRDQIKEGIGRLYRGGDHAYHENVPRGNAGRFAEWNTNNQMYAIATLPGSLVPLSQPEFVDRHARIGFKVVSKIDPQDPKKMIYEGRFSSSFANEYEPAESDKRDLSKIRDAAKTSGQAALNVATKK